MYLMANAPFYSILKTIIITTVCFFSVTTMVESVRLAPLYWNSTNSIFRSGKTSQTIEVNLSDEVDFICPFYHHSPTHPEYYIIYRVEEKSYKSCRLRGDEETLVVLNCSTPLQHKRYTILFETFNPIPNAPEFQAGKRYFFLSTSTGHADGLSNKQHGACTHQHMKIIFFVCCSPSSHPFNQPHFLPLNPQQNPPKKSSFKSSKKYNSYDKKPQNSPSHKEISVYSHPQHRSVSHLPVRQDSILKSIPAAYHHTKYHQKIHPRNKHSHASSGHHKHLKFPHHKSQATNKSPGYIKKRKKKVHMTHPKPESLYACFQCFLLHPSIIFLLTLAHIVRLLR